MRAVKAAFAGAMLGVCAHAALAQDMGQMAPPIPPADMLNYCVYGSLVYSVGSQICLVRGGPPLYCEQAPVAPPNGARNRASWTTNQPPGTLNCANEAISGGPGTPGSPYIIRRQPP